MGALRGIDTPVAVARYITGDMTLTEKAPAELKPALPDLPDLAIELTERVETAEVIYTSTPTCSIRKPTPSIRRLANGALAKCDFARPKHDDDSGEAGPRAQTPMPRQPDAAVRRKGRRETRADAVARRTHEERGPRPANWLP